MTADADTDRAPRRNVLAVPAVVFVAAVAVIVLLAPPNQWVAWSGSAPPDIRVRNVIVVIVDGWGYNHIAATNLYASGGEGRQPYEAFPVRYAMSTYPKGGRYDGRRAWADFGYVEMGATDSAAAATAMSTGVKTIRHVLGVDARGRPLKHVLERAEDLGKATGVVTSVAFSHATPAGFVVHNASRGNYEQIAREMIEQSPIDVIMGCGHPFYNRDGRSVPGGHGFKYAGGRELWNALATGRAGAGVDADHNGRLDDAWRLISAREAFRALARGPAPKRVIGVPRVFQTLQEKRSGDVSAAPGGAPFIETVPSLAEMTRAALNVLDDDPDGLFLMVEGGAVDWTSHGNESGRLIEEMLDLGRAVEAVIAWVEANSNWAETLVIVTGDHECGYLTRPSDDVAADPPWPNEPLVGRGAGRLPGMQWNSTSHTNSLVPFFAKGEAARLFEQYATRTDPVRGPTLDNTAVGRLIFSILRDGQTPPRPR